MPETEKNRALIKKKAEQYLKECEELAFDLGSHPEISGEEYRSAAQICRLLDSHGFKTELPYDDEIPTAFRATFEPEEGRRNVCLLTEYDALPEIGHACGHNVSCAISILSAFILKDLQDELGINVIVMGTPREESDGGKCILVEKGYFDDMDIAIMIHLYDDNYVDPALYAMNLLRYEFFGKSAHSAASPWDGRNALNGVMLMLHGLDMLRQHVHSDARFHWVICEGGKAPNIVPDRAACELHVRALDWDYVEELTRLVDDCAKGAAIATQTKFEKTITAHPNYNIKSNMTGTEVIEGVYRDLGLSVADKRERIFGSSDVGNVSQICPTFQPTLQLAAKGTALHTKEFADAACSENISEVIKTGSLIISNSIYEIFNDDSIYQKLKDDFMR